MFTCHWYYKWVILVANKLVINFGSCVLALHSDIKINAYVHMYIYVLYNYVYKFSRDLRGSLSSGMYSSYVYLFLLLILFLCLLTLIRYCIFNWLLIFSSFFFLNTINRHELLCAQMLYSKVHTLYWMHHPLKCIKLVCVHYMYPNWAGTYM